MTVHVSRLSTDGLITVKTVGLFNNNFANPFNTSPDNTINRLRSNFKALLGRVGNTYIYRQYTGITAATADEVTGETVSGNNEEYNNILIKAFTNHNISTDATNQISMIGNLDLQHKLLYIPHYYVAPRIKDLIFELVDTPPKTADSILAEHVLATYKILHIRPYKISDFTIYYSLFIQEV